MIRRLNVPVPDAATFSALVARRRPLGMRCTRAAFHLLRETYFDTTDGVLAAQGMTLLMRSEARGHHSLALSINMGVNLQGIAEERTYETPVVGAGLYSTLAGSSEVASRVRALVEPAALRPLAAIDIDRETRELRAGFFGNATHRIVFDDVIAHAPGSAREFQEVTIIELTRGRVTLEELGDRLRATHGVTSDGLDTYQRVGQALLAPKGALRAEAPNDVRVALMMVHDWDIALVEGPNGLMLPNARGSGENLAREFLVELQGGSGTGLNLDLIGFATSRRGGSDLEVWLHELVFDDRRGNFIWIPVLELMQRLGGPGLRDPELIATLLMVVRSEIGQRMLREAPHRLRAPCLLPPGSRPHGAGPGEGRDDFLDLDLSILDFNQRVLELAEDPALPLLERFRFLSIFSSNLDEFFVVRVGRMKDEVTARRGNVASDELTPEQLLDLVTVRVRSLLARQYFCLNHHLLPALESRGVRLVEWGDLSEPQRTALSERFRSNIFPLLTPLSLTVDPGRPFPRLVSLGLAVAVSLRRREGDRPELGYVPVPAGLDRFLPVPDGDDLIAIEHVIAANAGALFTSSVIESAYAFRASRVGDVELDEDNTGSLLAAVADEVESRPYKPVIRLEVDRAMPREVRAHLLKAIRDDQTSDGATLTRSDIYEATGPVDLSALGQLCELPIEGALFDRAESHDPLPEGVPIFELLATRDVLCHHPFHSFDATVGRFLTEAANDPDVVAIKLTLYRTGRRSPIMDALIHAVESGKDVSVFVELKARFDEESNIHWTHRLKEAGARVVYGVVGYKTHAKTALVVRKEAGGVRRYVHIGTGNYNAATSRFYTDFGLMSSDPDLGADLHEFFNELTGGAGPPQKQFRRLLVAPTSLVQGVERMVAREIDHAAAGRPARIQVKVNGLADRAMVKALYSAAAAGVQVDLIVRSICTLRPGVPGLSEGIRVHSILGRFLEHSRIYYFENGGQKEYYIGSADWRARNLRRRVEVVTPIDDEHARAVLRMVLDLQLEDPRAWVLRPDGVFERLSGEGADSQHRLMATRGGAEPVPR